jgi:hypothetical protein
MTSANDFQYPYDHVHISRIVTILCKSSCPLRSNLEKFKLFWKLVEKPRLLPVLHEFLWPSRELLHIGDAASLIHQFQSVVFHLGV